MMTMVMIGGLLVFMALILLVILVLYTFIDDLGRGLSDRLNCLGEVLFYIC